MNYKKIKPIYNENDKIGVNERLEQLKLIFPSAIKDGEVDFEALREELGDIKEVGKERYSFTWGDKYKAKLESQRPIIGKTLKYIEEDSKNADTTDNLYIEGDNLQAMKLLRENYLGRIKMIYIDPPYNTKKDFVYKDSWNISKEESDKQEGYVDEYGGRLEKNSDSSNRYHTDWLNMIYPRLKLAQQLLRDDGVIFISIDDNEVHNLRKVCDEIFGEENFVAQVIWERAFSPVNLKKHFSENHDFVLCYAKSIDNLECNGLKRSSEADDRYKNPDNDPRGVWTSGDFSVGPAVESNIYKIVSPSGRECYPPNGRSWRISEEKFKEMVADNRVWFGEDGNNTPRQKRFLSDVKNSVTSMTIWKYSEVGHTQDATKELKKLFNDIHTFDYSKTVKIIKRMLELYTNSNDTILDFFSGSATTAHAVMALNAEDGGNRKYIMVQLPELTDEKSEAYKAGYKNICEIGKERIRRAGDKIFAELQEKHNKYIEEQKKNEQLDIGQADDIMPLAPMDGEEEQENENIADTDKYIKSPDLLDIGFKVFKIGETNIKWNEVNSNDDIKTLEELAQTNKDFLDFTTDFTDIDVVYEIGLLQRGTPLSSKVIKLSDIGNRTYFYANNYLVCLEEEITKETIAKITAVKPQPTNFYFRDSAFGTDIALKDETFRYFNELLDKNHAENKYNFTVEFI